MINFKIKPINLLATGKKTSGMKFSACCCQNLKFLVNICWRRKYLDINSEYLLE